MISVWLVATWRVYAWAWRTIRDALCRHGGERRLVLALDGPPRFVDGELEYAGRAFYRCARCGREDAT